VVTRTDDHAPGADRPAASVAATYDRLAPRWDAYIAPSSTFPVAAWIRRADRFLRYGEPVVDLGCGTATPAAWIVAGRYRYIGVDLSAEMSARAAANAPGCSVHNSDMATVSFASAGIGAALCFDAINHVPRERHGELLGAIGRWLRPGGILIANFLTVDVAEVWEPSWLDAGPMYWSSYAIERTLGLLDAAGFQVVDDALLSHEDYDGHRRERLWLVAHHAGGSGRRAAVPSSRTETEGPTE
jgi:SAM-dependent methyltransferase